MARNGSGIYSLPPVYLAVSGTKVRAEQHNTPLEDVAVALTDSLPRNGVAPMVGNLNMNGRKVINLGVATASTDAVSLSQLASTTVTFAATVKIPVTTVQTAIERVQTNTDNAFANAGIAATVAPLLANIDATTIASGNYRYDATTTGTFPTGVTKADTGTVTVSPGATGNAVMELTPLNGFLSFKRVMNSLAWQIWREIPVLSGMVAGDMIYRGATSWVRIPKGTTGQVLQQGASAPEWVGALGINQSWQDVAASRAVSTSYQNTTGAPIQLAIITSGSGSVYVEASANGSSWVQIGVATAFADRHTTSGVIPNGHYYRINGAATIESWAELR